MTMYWHSSANSTTRMRSRCEQRPLSDGTYQHICDVDVRIEEIYNPSCVVICDLCNMSFKLHVERDIMHNITSLISVPAVVSHLMSACNNVYSNILDTGAIVHVITTYMFTYLLTS